MNRSSWEINRHEFKMSHDRQLGFRALVCGAQSLDRYLVRPFGRIPVVPL